MSLFRRKAPSKPPPTPTAKAPVAKPINPLIKTNVLPAPKARTPKPANPLIKPGARLGALQSKPNPALATPTTRPSPQLSENARRELDLERINLGLAQRAHPDSVAIKTRLAELDRLLGLKKWPPTFND